MLKQDVFVTAGAYDAHVVQISTTHCADIMPFFLEGGWDISQAGAFICLPTPGQTFIGFLSCRGR